MISFPNTTNQGGSFNVLYDDDGNRVYTNDDGMSKFDVSRIKSFNMNLNASIKKAMLDDISLDMSNNSFRTPQRQILGKGFTIYKGEPIETTNNGESSVSSASKDNPLTTTHENPFTIPAPLLTTINRYNRIYKTPLNNLMNAGQEQLGPGGEAKGIEITVAKQKVLSSSFNTIHYIPATGMLDNLPVVNMQSSGANDWVSIGSADSIGLTPGKNVVTKKTFDKHELTFGSNNKVIKDGKEYDYNSDGTLTRKEGSKTITYSEQSDQSDFVRTLLGQEYDSTKNDSTNKNAGWQQDSQGNVSIKINYNPFNTDFIDNSGNCTIRELVRMSHTPNGQLGMSKYKYADFLFCKNVGKVSNNHMITLRRFAHPVGDNIFRFSGKGYLNDIMPGYHGHQENASIGTMITWFGTDDNKLEDILSYSVKSSWREFKAKIDEIDTAKEDDPSTTGLLGLFSNSLNPAYNSAVAKGMAGSNSLWNKMGTKIFGSVIGKANAIVGGQNAGSNGVSSDASERWKLMRMGADNNKIYTPQNTIQKTHKYEGELELSHEFTLNFSYRLRALDIMNPKTVMLDLLGNILEVTYNRGHFWGGERRFIGPPRNASNVAKANAFIDRQWEKLEGFMMGFANGTLDWKGILSSLSDMVSSAVNTIKSAAEGKGGYAKLFLDGAQKLAGKFVSAGASRALLGQLKNQLGRPAVYAMDSLLDGSPVGMWHVTIGNPKNPIAAFGNLMMMNTKITHTGPLGFDDFPTELKVSCTLKHGRSRDLSEVARMYTKGTSAFYMAVDKNKLSEFFTVSNTSSGRNVETEISKANYARGLSEQAYSFDAKAKDIDNQIADLQKKASNANDSANESAKQSSEAAQQETKQGEREGDKNNDSSTEQKEVKTTTNSETSEDAEKKKEEAEQAKKQIAELLKEKQDLENQRNFVNKQLQDASIQKYLRDDYSMIYGTPEELKNMRASVKELYSDLPNMQTRGADYYRRGHYIRDNWALRYETLGQDLDTEGRILIDENA